MKKFLLGLVLLLTVGAGLWTWRALGQPYRGFTGNVILEVAPGTRFTTLARDLVARGVLRRQLPFIVLSAIGHLRHNRLQAGEYLFDRAESPREVYEKIAQGRVYLHLVVIPEGSDRFDMARVYHDKLGIEPQDFLRLTADATLVRDLDPQAPSLEGFLFPDSYLFPRGTHAATVVETMVARFRHVLTAKFHGLAPGSSQLHDTLVLASLVEKETPNPAERPMIAGVFERRLAEGMLLQCDPTVVYAARLAGEPAAEGHITQSELDADSPYNTYHSAGLPPGPICSPGQAALRAAMEPATGDALYFVSDNRGGHIFARTLDEHRRNVARYRRQTEVAAVSAAGHTATAKATRARGKSRRAVSGNRKRSNKRVRKKKQKAAHSGLPSGARARASGRGGDSGHSR